MMGTVRTFGVDEVGAADSLARGYPYLFDGQYRGDVIQDSLAQAYLGRLKSSLSSGARTALAWWERQEVQAVATFEQLGWDSEHFGIPMARLELVVGPAMTLAALQALVRASLGAIAGERVAHVAARVPVGLAAPQQALASCGFHPVGVKVMLRRRRAVESTRVGATVPDAQVTPAEMAGVRALAASAMTDSRFHSDGRFDPGRVAAVYVSWVERIYREHPDRIIVARDGGDIVGFLAYEIGIALYGLQREHLGMDTGFVGLVAVLDRVRGRGIGKGLITESVDRMWAAGCRVAYANVMLSNESSVNAFLGAGFTLMGSLQEFHLWL
jgi:ribosomal protein S18 acetylase RimI-like enzyme